MCESPSKRERERNCPSASTENGLNLLLKCQELNYKCLVSYPLSSICSCLLDRPSIFVSRSQKPHTAALPEGFDWGGPSYWDLKSIQHVFFVWSPPSQTHPGDVSNTSTGVIHECVSAHVTPPKKDTSFQPLISTTSSPFQPPQMIMKPK